MFRLLHLSPELNSLHGFSGCYWLHLSKFPLIVMYVATYYIQTKSTVMSYHMYINYIWCVLEVYIQDRQVQRSQEEGNVKILVIYLNHKGKLIIHPQDIHYIVPLCEPVHIRSTTGQVITTNGTSKAKISHVPQSGETAPD